MKKLLILSFFILLTVFAKAQQPKRKMLNKVEDYKISFLVQRLDLTPDEAKIFWPIYNEMVKEQEALRKERMQNVMAFRRIKELEDLTDSEIQEMLNAEFDFKQKNLNNELKYFKKLKTSLSIKVVGKFYRAQEAFKKELLNKIKDNK